MTRKLVAAGALTAVVLAQLTIVNGLSLPGGGTPDLVLLCVIAFGMTGGPAVGVIAGFYAGLALDLAPPASHPVGQYALVLCLVGYGASKLRFTLRHSALLALGAAAAMAPLGEITAAGLALMLDAPDVSWAIAARLLPPSVLLDIVLSPVTLFVSVRLAVGLGMTVGQLDDSPVPETGGTAAPRTVAAQAGWAGMDGVSVLSVVNGARIGGMPRGRHRGAPGGDSRAAATGRWLVGDVAEAAPAIGAVGWLAGSANSRRARREQARLTAMLTGASPRRGAFWVGRRPPGLLPRAPVAPPSTSGLARLRPGGGVPGSAVAIPRPNQTGLARPGRAIHLGLADEQRKRARGANGRPRATRLAAPASDRGGLHRFTVNGFVGPDLPRIAFGTGGLPGAGRAAGRPVPRIAFGTGGLPGAGRAAGRPVPRIAFRSASLGSAARAISDGAGTAPGLAAPGPRGSGYRGMHRFGPDYRGGRAVRASRKRRQPRFARGMSGHQPSRSRQPKLARMRAGHRAFRRLAWMRRAGDRSAVWRIGSTRMSGLK
jgi:rod shape-determining protein MreD